LDVSSRPAPAGIASSPLDPAPGRLSAKLKKPVEGLALELVPVPEVLVLVPLLVLLLPLVVVVVVVAPLLVPLVLAPALLVLLALGGALLVLVLVLVPALELETPELPELVLLLLPPQAESAIEANKQTTAAFLMPSPFGYESTHREYQGGYL
jgi:hypothetical protein